MAPRKRYRALVGLNYPPNGKGTECRAEPGDVVNDLPADAIADLLQDGSIAELDEEAS